MANQKISDTPEPARTVTGNKGSAIRTTEDGSIATDNYPYADAFEYDGSAYPYTIDTSGSNASVIQAVTLTRAGDVDMEVTTELGNTFTVRLDGVIGEFSNWEVDTVTFRDPRGKGTALYGSWSGE